MSRSGDEFFAALAAENSSDIYTVNSPVLGINYLICYEEKSWEILRVMYHDILNLFGGKMRYYLFLSVITIVASCVQYSPAYSQETIAGINESPFDDRYTDVIGEVFVDKKKYDLQIIYGEAAKDQISKFEKELNNEQKYLTCTRVIDMPNGQNNSYGAICSFEKKKTIHRLMVCCNEMTGKLETKVLLKSHEGKSTSDLVKFVVQNCTGG